MKKILRNISYLLLMLAMLPALSGCDTEDDLIEIFTGKTWKMSRLTMKGSNARFLPNLWDSQDSMDKSLRHLEDSGKFTLDFEGSEVDGQLLGTRFTAYGVNATLTGTWNADGDSHSLTFNVEKSSGSESDPLAKAFINGLKNVYKYEGDASSLTLYFKDGDVTKVIGFTHQREN